MSFRVFTFFIIFMMSVSPDAQAAAPATASTPVVACKSKIMVVPLYNSDIKYNGWLMREVQSSYMKTRKLKCDPFLSADESAQQFEFLGPSARSPDLIRNRQLEFLKERTDVDKLLYFEVNKAKKNTLEMQLFKIVSKKGDLSLDLVQEGDIPYDAKSAKKNRSSFTKRAFTFLMPNTFSFGGSNVSASLNLDERLEEKSVKNKSSLPALLSSISFGQISHPDSYGLFDISYNVYPGVFFFALDQFTEVAPKEGAIDDAGQPLDPNPTTYHLKATGVNFNLNGEITFHSPIGATYFSLGVGPSYFSQATTGNASKSEFTLYDVRVRFGHRAFFTKNVFISLDLDQVSLTSSAITNAEGTVSTSNITRSTVSIGLYFPITTLY